MLILGIDPGTATTGYGVVNFKNQNFELIDFGLIETNKDGSPEKRLLDIYKQITKIFKKFKPDVMAIEKVFFATNAKTAMRVGEALGVMLFSAARANTKVVEYAPGTIKKVVAGNGRAEKDQIINPRGYFQQNNRDGRDHLPYLQGCDDHYVGRAHSRHQRFHLNYPKHYQTPCFGEEGDAKHCEGELQG